MNRRVLCVDDEQAVLEGFRRNLRKQADLHLAGSATEALTQLDAHKPVAVILTDMRMPGMSGLELLAEVQRRSPQTVRMMLTGDADLGLAMDAVNHGQVFRFLTKPCATDVLRTTIAAGLEQYRLVTAEKELLEQTLAGSIHLITELMGLMDESVFQHARQVRSLSTMVARHLERRMGWQMDLAVLLGRIGEFTLPGELRRKRQQGRSLNAEETALVAQVPSISARLLRHIPRLHEVADLLEDQRPGAGSDGAILHTVDAYVALLEAGYAADAALETLARQDDRDKRVLAAIAACTGKHARDRDRTTPAEADQLRSCRIRDLSAGMILLEDLRLADGRSLITAGHTLSPAMLERVRNFQSLVGLCEPVRVRLAQAEDPA